MGRLLDTITRLFNTHVLGANRVRLIASCIDIAARHGADERATQCATGPPQERAIRSSAVTGDHLVHIADLEINLATLPTGRLRRLLNAFVLQIHYDADRQRATFHIRISALLQPTPAPHARLRVEAPAGPPVLNPAAAQALLALLIHLASTPTETNNHAAGGAR